jgi:hypothetical protein
MSPSDTVYCVCEKDFSHKLVADTETGNSKEYESSYQWYVGTVPDIASGTAIPGATDKVYYTPSGLDVGKYYYYCIAQSEYSSTPFYSRIATVEVEPDNAEILFLEVNGQATSLTKSESSYLAECGEDSVVIDVMTTSKYARVTVNGAEYSDNPVIYLTEDVTRIVIRTETCDGTFVHEHTLTVTKALRNLIYQRFYNSLGVDRNSAKNGGYTDIRGVRWYGKDDTEPFRTDTVDNINEPSSENVSRNWVIRLEDLDPSLFRAEVNISGKWHKLCGERQTSDSKIIVYPNPASEGENVTVQLPFKPSTGYMNIFTINGSLVKQNIPLTSESNIIRVSDFSTGAGRYVLQVVCHRSEGDVNKQDSFILIVY